MDHYNLHTQKIPSHDKFLVTSKRQLIDNEEEELKNSKLVKLEIPVEKVPRYEYYYETEGPIELSQLNVKSDWVYCIDLCNNLILGTCGCHFFFF